jgi:hypothetical protein
MPMENYLCDLNGISTFISNGLFVILISIMICFMGSIREWLKGHFNNTIVHNNDPYNIKIKIWNIYIIIPISGVVFLFLLPYYLTVPIFGNFHPILYCITAVPGIFFTFMLGAIINMIADTCNAYEFSTKLYREKSN